MPMIPKYCSQCGQKIEEREVDGRMREVCPECNTVFYRNPLPVAAVILLNQKREILLVRRKNEPRKGMWCLPMGFAEVNETIAHASLRELEEEAGVKGRVSRLIAVMSNSIEPYGDLLIVTFEVEKTGGQEQAGDDAEEVAYFPLDSVPPLAFEANESAIKYCIKVHSEEWAIQDSFRQIQKGGGSIGMLSDALVVFIRDHAKEISDLWFNEVTANPTTPAYSRIESSLLLQRASGAISQFSSWLSGNEADDEVRDFYIKLGIERNSQGCGLSEVISSLTLLRKHILLYAVNQGVWERAIDAYTVLELDRRIILFFDKAMYYTARGFARES